MDGWTGEWTNGRALRTDQIRNGRWSIEACQHPFSAEQSRSGYLLQLPHSLFVSSFRFFFATFSIFLALPTSTSPPRRGFLNFSPRVSSSLSYSFPPTILLVAFFSPHLRRVLFSSSFSRCDLPSPPRHPVLSPLLRCWTGTRNSSSLLTHDSTILEYASSRSIQPRYYSTNIYTCARLFRIGVVRSLRAMR